MKEYEQALDSFRDSIQLDSKYALAYHGLGNIYYQTGKFQTAAENFKRATELDPKLADAHTALGESYFHVRKYREATQAFREAVTLDPSSAEARYNLAIACLNISQRSCALEQYNLLKAEQPYLSAKLFQQIFQSKIVNGGVHQSTAGNHSSN